MRKLFVFIFLGWAFTANAQDNLFTFKVRDLGKQRIQISWNNAFETMVQISIQRSYDSVKGYRTIFSPQSPELPSNGFVDTKAGTNKAWYRVLYVLQGGAFFFTKPTRPMAFTIDSNDSKGQLYNQLPPENQLITIKLKETIFAQLAYPDYIRFRDSIVYKTKDTLQFVSATEVILKPAIPAWKPSENFYTNESGYPEIKLKDVAKHQYTLIITDDKGKELYHIDKLKEPILILDKTNFIKAGWYFFEIYKNNQLIEQNKFYLPKD
jgi:hypothetical protein